MEGKRRGGGQESARVGRTRERENFFHDSGVASNSELREEERQAAESGRERGGVEV